MYQMTSAKTELAERIAGVLGILCFFLPFITASIWGTSRSVSGFAYLWGILTHPGEAVSQDTMTILWTAGALIAGIIGIIATFAVTTLVGGIANTAAVGCLFLLKEYVAGESGGFLQTGIGWTLSLVAFMIAAVCGYLSVYLSGRATTWGRTEEASAMSDEDFVKLCKGMKQFRADGNDKK